MGKYYIKSGNLKFIIDRDNYKQAIYEALAYARYKSIATGQKVCVSEKGFETFKEWICYDTKEYLKGL